MQEADGHSFEEVGRTLGLSPPACRLPDSHIGFRWHPARPPARLPLALPPSPAFAKAGVAPTLFVTPAKTGAHP